MLDKPNISGYLSRIGRREFNWTIRIVVNLFRVTEFDIVSESFNFKIFNRVNDSIDRVKYKISKRLKFFKFVDFSS